MKISSDDRLAMAKTIISDKKVIYIKPYRNKTKCFCTQCLNTFTVSKDQLKEIHNSHMCPQCWRKASKIHDHSDSYSSYVSIPATDYKDYKYNAHNAEYGCSVDFDWEFDHPKNLMIKKVAVFEFNGNEASVKTLHFAKVRDLFISSFFSQRLYEANGDRKTGKWRQPYSLRKYWTLMYGIRDFSFDESVERNDYTVFDNPKMSYLKDTVGDISIKSTQAEIVKKHILNQLQIQRMLMFDLNSYDDVKKCNYSTGSHWSQVYDDDQVKKCMELHLNKYDEQYVRKNKIYVGDYIDYLAQCKQLCIKNKHPKNFTDEHEKMSEKIRSLEDEKRQELFKNSKAIINAITDQLPTYKCGKLSITPVMSIEELKNNARYMHNCIFGYAENYMKKKCILYIVRSNRTIVANVELNGSRVVQIRARYNKDPSAAIVKAVNCMVADNITPLERAMYG